MKIDPGPTGFGRIRKIWKTIVFNTRLLIRLPGQGKLTGQEPRNSFQWSWLIPKFRLQTIVERWKSWTNELKVFWRIFFTAGKKLGENKSDSQERFHLLKPWLIHDWRLFQESAAKPLRFIWKLAEINFELALFRTLSVLIGATLGWIGISIVVVALDSIKLGDSSRPVLQAAKYNYFPSVFYFPFSKRGIDTLSAEAFTEDLNLGVRYNSHGFQTAEYTIAHPPNTFRILIIGDLQFLSLGTPPDETFPYLLQKSLNGSCTKLRFEVIALGGLGHRFADSVVRLLAHGQSLKPDLVIFQLGVNGVELYDYMSIFYLQDKANFYTRWQAKAEEVLKENSIDFNVFRESLDVIQDWSRKKSVPVSFVLFPTLDVAEERGNFQRYNLQYPGLPYYIVSAGTITGEIQKHGNPVLYMVEPFQQKAGDRYLAVSRMNAGPNPYAHQLTAESLSTFLLQEKLVECSAINPRLADWQWRKEKILRDRAAAEWKKFNRSYYSQLMFFKEIRKLYPVDPWITGQFAAVYLGQRDWGNACSAYRLLSDSRPGLSFSAYHRAICEDSMKTKIQALETMLRDVPDHSSSMELLAQYYLEAKQTEQACRVLYRLTEVPLYEKQLKKAKKLFAKNSCRRFLKR